MLTTGRTNYAQTLLAANKVRGDDQTFGISVESALVATLDSSFWTAAVDGGDDLAGGSILGILANGLAATQFSPVLRRQTSTKQPTSVSASTTAVVASASEAAPTSVNVAEGATVTIEGAGTQSVAFAGSTGTLAIERSADFAAKVSGLAGTDEIDLADLKFTSQTQATYLGDATGGTLTVTNGTQTVNIQLEGDYLSSEWTVSNDGNGGVAVVDPTVSTTWQTLPIGGGGFADGLDIAPNGAMVVRTDTNGAYLWTGSSWKQLVNASSMPASFVAANPVSSGAGVYEIQMAPSNPNIMYMMFDGYVFVSSNQGTSWTQTSFAQVTVNANDDYRTYGQKMAVDPNNPNIVYVGTPQNGLFVSTNGGQTWSSVAAVPVSATTGGQYPGITGILFDPAAGGVVNGVTQTLFASSYGNGVYESTNGGTSWTHLSGGPADVEYAAVSSNGAYYAVGSNKTALWTYEQGLWTQVLSSPSIAIASVAVNPLNANEIVAVSAADYLDVSYDGGKTWSGWDEGNTLSTTDIPWLASANKGGNYAFLSIGGVAFSTTTPNELIASAGTGVWNVSVPTSGLTTTTNLTWNDMSVGIENLVAIQVLAPPGGAPVLASWDRPFFYDSNLGAYPTTYGPVATSSIVAGWSLDYASSTPSFVVGLADFWGVEESGYSTNGGQTWTPFATELSGAGSSFIGGTIAASTTKNFIWAPAGGVAPYYTLDGGQTWKQISLPGVTSWSGFDWAYYLNTRTVTADRALSNTFYLYYNGVYESTNGGATWNEVYSSPLGAYGANSSIQAAPGMAGTLFYTAGIQGNGTNPTSDFGFYMSTNQGSTWTAVANVLEVTTFGFGAAASGSSDPSLYIVGYVNKVYGIWASTNLGQSWVQIGTQAAGNLDQITTISGDGSVYGQVYVGFSGGGYAYLSATGATTTPVISTNTTTSTTSTTSTSLSSGTSTATTGVTTVVASTSATVTDVMAITSAANLAIGDTITFVVDMSKAVTVSGGTPTLSLNNGGIARYVSGSGSTALRFNYTISPTNTAVAAFAITGVSTNGATIVDASGVQANLANAAVTFSTSSSNAANIANVTETPATGVLGPGNNVTFSLTMTESVVVNGGVPTLTLNDGGIATYVSGSGGNTLTFSYTVKTSDTNTSSLVANQLNLNGATIKNSAGVAANLSLSLVAEAGPQIVIPTPSTVPASPAITLSGSNNIITVSSQQISVSGAGVLAVSGSDDLFTLSGTGETIVVTGADDAVDMTAAGDIATIGGKSATAAENYARGTDDTINVSANSRADVYGSHDTINIGSASNVGVHGSYQTVTLGTGDNLWLSDLTNSNVSVTNGGGTIETYLSSNNDIFHLIDGAGRYNSAASVVNALKSDGNGGTILSLGANSLHFLNVAPSALSASNFQIG